jgi:hypothetical protein
MKSAGVSRFRLPLHISFLLWSCLWPGASLGQVNSWTKPTSGVWEEPWWSLGGLPSGGQSAIMITNAGYKAVAVGISTRDSHPDSMTISNLTLTAPGNSFNTLLLNYAGSRVPLRILDSFTLGSNASLINLASSLKVEGTSGGAFYVGGTVDHGENAQAIFNSARIGYLGEGAVFLSSGLMTITNLSLGDTHPGTFNQSGGTNLCRFVELLCQGGARYVLSNGTLAAEGIVVGSGFGSREARFDFWDGSIILGNFFSGLTVGSSGGSGDFNMFGGRFSGGIAALSGYGTFRQLGGTNMARSIGLGSGNRSQGTYILSNAMLSSASVALGGQGFGYFHQLSGVHVTDNISCQGDTYYPSQGSYNLEGGFLEVRRIALGFAGVFHQAGGTNNVPGDISLAGGSAYRMSSGILLVSNISIRGHPSGDPFVSVFTQTGGTIAVTNALLLESASTYSLQGGTISASSIYVGDGALFEHTGGSLVNSAMLYLTGTLKTSGLNQQFGAITLDHPPSSGGLAHPVMATNDLGNGACVQQFADSHAAIWSSQAILHILRWSGSASGNGRDQIRFGHSQLGLTTRQLGRIRFVNPEGWPADSYHARILSTGEIVPTTSPTMRFDRDGTRLVIDWPKTFTLQTGTNIRGPFYDLTNATRPFTNGIGLDPERYFRLRK